MSITVEHPLFSKAWWSQLKSPDLGFQRAKEDPQGDDAVDHGEGLDGQDKLHAFLFRLVHAQFLHLRHDVVHVRERHVDWCAV